MAAEPINIFSRKIDPRGVLVMLRRLAPGLKVTGPEDDWRRIEIPFGKRLLRKPRLLAFNHDPEYYDGPNWPNQVLGMQGYFSRFPESPRKPDVLRLISTFRFALAAEFDPEREADDDRLALVSQVCKFLDGVIFTPSALLDATGRVLLSADGEFDPEAVLPGMPPVDPAAEDEDLEPHEPEPPSPLRVARRALALAAVTGRALLEQEDPADPANGSASPPHSGLGGGSRHWGRVGARRMEGSPAPGGQTAAARRHQHRLAFRGPGCARVGLGPFRNAVARRAG